MTNPPSRYPRDAVHEAACAEVLNATSAPVRALFLRHFRPDMYPLSWVKTMIADLETLGPSPLVASATPLCKEDKGQPPPHIVDLAIDVSRWSPCRSKRGVVIFSEGDVVSHGNNYKPRGFDCDGSDACKATCRREAIHAEQQALMAAGNRAHASEMLHVKTIDGQLVPSGGPSCVECSKLALAAGIAWFWLYHADGWQRYEMKEFHRLSLAAAPPVLAAPPQEVRRCSTREIVMDHADRKTLGHNPSWVKAEDYDALAALAAPPPREDTP